MDTLSGQYGFNTKTELKEAMYSTGKTKFGQGSARNEVLFGEDGLKAGATKEEFMERIQEIGFDSDIANACWEVLNMDTDGDSADVIDEEEYNKLITMYGSDFNGEQIDELNEITVGSFYTLLNTPRDVYDSSADGTGAVVDNPSQPSVSPEASAAPENEAEDDNVNTRLITFMSNFINEVDELLTNSDTEFSDVINLAKHYNFSEYTDNPPTSAQEIEYRSQMVDKAISMYTYAETPDDISSLNDSTNLLDVIYASFDDNDLREQKLTDLFTTISEIKLDTTESNVDWGQYDMSQCLQQLLNNQYTNADIQALFSQKGGVENIISEVMNLDSSSQKQYLDALLNSMLNVEENEDAAPDSSVDSNNTTQNVRPMTDDTPISDTSASYFADKINGSLPFQNMDYTALQNVLSNQNLSQEDILKIWTTYSEKYGNLLENLDLASNVTMKNSTIETLTDIAIEQAQNGNTEAITILAKELKASSDNMRFSPDHFMSYFFENIDTKTLSIITQEYSQVNNNSTLASDLNGFISFGRVAGYVKQVEEAMSIL